MDLKQLLNPGEPDKKVVILDGVSEADKDHKHLTPVRPGERVIGECVGTERNMLWEMLKARDLYDSLARQNTAAVFRQLGDYIAQGKIDVADPITMFMSVAAIMNELPEQEAKEFKRLKDEANMTCLRFNMMKSLLLYSVSDRLGDFTTLIGFRKGFLIVDTGQHRVPSPVA